MRHYNPKNERVKKDYFRFLKEADRKAECTVDAARKAIARFETTTGRRLEREGQADSEFVTFIERQLAGAIGAASARIMIASVLREEMHDIDEVTRILDFAACRLLPAA